MVLGLEGCIWQIIFVSRTLVCTLQCFVLSYFAYGSFFAPISKIQVSLFLHTNPLLINIGYPNYGKGIINQVFIVFCL